jgi:hypothetical protein
MGSKTTIRGILGEAEVADRNAEGVLGGLWRHSVVAEPPPGYEHFLVSEVMRKIEVSTDSRSKKLSKASGWAWIKSPQMAWSFGLGALAVAIGVWMGGPETAAPEDLLSRTALRSDPVEVQRWLASVGDAGFRVQGDGFEGLIAELRDNKRQAEALDKVAESLGLTL